jgi:hypothetical protein
LVCAAVFIDDFGGIGGVETQNFASLPGLCIAASLLAVGTIFAAFTAFYNQKTI